jgi:hypothetical protein
MEKEIFLRIFFIYESLFLLLFTQLQFLYSTKMFGNGAQKRRQFRQMAFVGLVFLGGTGGKKWNRKKHSLAPNLKLNFVALTESATYF